MRASLGTVLRAAGACALLAGAARGSASVDSCKKTVDGQTYDFTALRNSRDNYRVEVGSVVYYLNVCGDLVNTKEITDAKCPLASSACKVENGKASSVGRATDDSFRTSSGG
jgi:hypothetical protein